MRTGNHDAVGMEDVVHIGKVCCDKESSSDDEVYVSLRVDDSV